MTQLGDDAWIAATEHVEATLTTLTVRSANGQSGTTSHGELLTHLAALGALVHLEVPEEIR